MIFTTTELQDALVQDIATSIPSLKSVDSHEPELDAEELKKMILRTPFCLVSCVHSAAAEDHRLESGAAGKVVSKFALTFGGQSLRKQTAAMISVYSLMDAAKNALDGKYILIGQDPKPTKNFMWEENIPEFSVPGLVVWSSMFRIEQI